MSKNDRKMAAALKYDRTSDQAPKLVAKGRGYIAEKILEVAAKAGVPMRSDPSLVQILCRLDMDEQIPVELYRAVAEILAFVYAMNERRREQ
ncbi:MAG: EscU/YscU/HrcU family type III secretion system export apparatus switch protein [Deltaproteobacteria bacterium]|nr:EscU/YscU/HrcU family type III secretion system export apparatus switch protein [Deltaproteobacteria bacterium]